MYYSQITTPLFYSDAHHSCRIRIGTTAPTRMIFKHTAENVSSLIAS